MPAALYAELRCGRGDFGIDDVAMLMQLLRADLMTPRCADFARRRLADDIYLRFQLSTIL